MWVCLCFQVWCDCDTVIVVVTVTATATAIVTGSGSASRSVGSTMIIIIIIVTMITLSSFFLSLLTLWCRPYVLPDHYTIPVVPGDYNAIDKPRGMLFVTIISAKHVPKMDWFNGSDPYVWYTTRTNY